MSMKGILCVDPTKIVSKGIWLKSNPLQYASPLLMLQLSVISVTTMLIDLCLQPLGQSTLVSKIFGGIVFGPSLLGHESVIGSQLIPRRSTVILETFATFGLMFFFFLTGVKMDGGMMVKPNKVAVIISISVMFIPLLFGIVFALLLKTYIPMDTSLANALPFIAASQCLTAFPNIACLLTELKILNTDIGRLAINSSMFCDIVGISLTAVGFAIVANTGTANAVLSGLSTFSYVMVVVYIVRPIVLWALRRAPKVKPVGEAFTNALFIGVLITGFTGEAIGQHFIFGPLVFGLAIPDGPPLGAAMVEKLESIVSGLLYPTFLTISGLKTDIFKIHWKSAAIVTLIVVFTSVVKIFAVALPARYFQVPKQEAFVLGLLMNARGICELIIYNLVRDQKVLSDQEFSLTVLSVIGVTAVITPLIRFLYDPTRHIHPLPTKRRTIQHTKRDAELRILICIHSQDSVPMLVNLLEASCPTQESPIAVILLLLVELKGRTSPMLISHQKKQLESVTSNKSSFKSDNNVIIKAFNQYELHNQDCATVDSFSAISHFATIHEDICRVALDQQATIVILPFHKVWAIDGTIGSQSRTFQNMNFEVMHRAPCSVGILVDRGTLKGSLSIITSQSMYRVAVIFIGGPDDAEALSYGARMARHRCVTLTVIRFLLFGCDNARERKFDNELVNEVRYANAANDNFTSREEVVRDGQRLAESIKGLEDSFDLIICGREHQESTVLGGLHVWSECPELGVIGDLLASPDFGGATSVLVVQQQRILGGKLISRATKPVISHVGSPHRSSAASSDQGLRWSSSINSRT